MRNAPLPAPNPPTFRARGRREGRVRLPVVAVLLLPVLGACAKQDLKSEIDRTRSWTATTRLAAERRATDAINGAVTRQLAVQGEKARSEAGRSLGELAKTASERTAARAVLDSLDEGLARLRKAAP